MKKVYIAPAVVTQELQLGVYGDYGQGGSSNPQPNRGGGPLYRRMD